MGECGNELLRRCAAFAITPEANKDTGAVCGSDGRTYSTLSQLECAQLKDKCTFLLYFIIFFFFFKIIKICQNLILFYIKNLYVHI